MQQNILKNTDITKIYLIYVDNGSRKKILVNLRFMDNKEFFFSCTTPLNFVKPKKKIPAELHVFTPDGVYKSNVTLLDSDMSLREVLYRLSIPKSWDYMQLRRSSRKRVELPICIKFNDGYEINANTCDLSLGGISFVSKEPLSSIYKKVSGILTLQLPKQEVINFPEGKLTVEIKFVREKELDGDNFGSTLFIFKFVGNTPEDETILKNYLMKLD